MFLWRVIVIIIWVPVILFITVYGDTLHFALMTIAFITFGIIEYTDLFKAKGKIPNVYVAILGSMTISILMYLYDSTIALYILVFIFLASLVWGILRGRTSGYIFVTSVTLNGIFYVGFLLGHLILIRKMVGGQWIVTLLFLTIWILDVACYLMGKGFGRKKIAPEISPRKTREGAISGIVIGTAIFTLGSYLIPGIEIKSLVVRVIIGVIISVAGILGDLVESAMKRDAGVKDSGKILPGHGGVLDRFDSMIFAAPTLYYLLMLFEWLGC